MSCLVALWVSSWTVLTPAVDDAVSAEVRSQLSEILARPALKDARVGLYVVRMSDGAELFAHHADTLMVPASNVKIVTTAAALHHLGPDYRFRTEILGEAASDGVVRGDIVLRGNGDPTLVPERVWYLASRLTYLGIRAIQGDIVVDDTYFAGPRLALGWEQDSSSSAYMAPAGAVSVGFNAVMIHVLPGAAVGEPARVLVEPGSDYATLDNQTVTIPRGRTSVNAEVEAQGERSVIKVTGKITARDAGRGFWRRIDNPSLFSGEVLKRTLQQVGITVKGKIRVGVAPPEPKVLATLDSPRLAELLLRVNKNSSNFTAQQVALALGAALFGAPGTWEKGKLATESFLMHQVGVSPGTYELANASGLHDVNRFTPQQLVAVLQHMAKRPELWPEYQASFAVAAGSGTLADRMRDTEAAHLLRAKTGTLSIASALSGVVPAKSGELLAFSIIVNDYTTSVHEVWQAQDALGDLLAATRFGAEPATAEVGVVTQGEVRP